MSSEALNPQRSAAAAVPGAHAAQAAPLGLTALVGHVDARRALLAALARAALPHALLFSGESGIGKRRLAEWLVAARWCEQGAPASRPCGACATCRKVAAGQHPDLDVVQRNPGKELDPQELGSRTEITVDQIRRGLLPALALRAVEGRGRAAVIDDAESLNEAAQNALLKTLEEPPEGCLLVLVCAHEEALLDTVRSRCQVVRLSPLEPGEMAALFPDADPEALRLAAGRPGRVHELKGLPVGMLATLLEQVLAGALGGAAFARAVQDALAQREAGETGAGERDAESEHRLVAELLLRHWRNLLARGAQPVAASAGAEVEAALLEIAADLARHVPAAVAWAAAGQSLARAAASTA